jgi:hypothetical protein
VNRKVLSLNLALLALIGLLVWQLRARRQAAEAHERAVLLKDGQGRTLLAPPAPAPVPPVAPAEYIDSVQRMLFAKDRNPNVIVDPPPPAPPPKHEEPKPMPPLPRYYGQIHFGGDPVVILSSAAANDQKSYAVGEKIGAFTVVAFDKDSITFDWDGKQVERSLTDLKPKDPQAPQQQQQSSAPPPQPAQSSVVAIGASPSASTVPPGLGIDVGGGYYGCKAGDTSPSGTIVDGYRKVQNMGLMGSSCRWEKVQ